MSNTTYTRHRAMAAAPLGEHVSNVNKQLADNGGSEEDAYILLTSVHLGLTGKTPLSSDSQASACSTDGGSSACGTLSDVSPTPSSFDKSPAFSDHTSTPRSMFPSKPHSRVPSLDVIAARMRKVAQIDAQSDQENGGHNEQSTPVRPAPRHAFPSLRREERTPSKQQQPLHSSRDRSDILASLADRASDRSRSVSPMKKETVPGQTEQPLPTSSSAKDVPSLQDIVKRMGTKKDGPSTTSSPALAPSTSPPRTPKRTAVTPLPLKRDSATNTESPAKMARLECMKTNEHPLEHRWSIYFDSKTWNPSASQGVGADPLRSPAASKAHSWEATLKLLGRYDTVENFMTVFRTLRRPSQLDRNSNYHLFKDGIKPMWEDPANVNGGKWIITLRTSNPALMDRSWMWLVLALIGEDLDEADDVTGAVVSTRTKGDRIALWIRDKSDVDLVNKIGRRFVGLLDVENEAGVSLEFTANTSADVGNASFSSSTSSSSAGARSSSKYIGFSNPITPHNTSFPPGSALAPPSSLHTQAKSPFTPQHQQHNTTSAHLHHAAASPLSHAQHYSFTASHSSSPIQAQGTLGAHLRVYASPGKTSLTASSSAGSMLGRSPVLSGAPGILRRGSHQDVDASGSAVTGLGFSVGLGAGPIGRTSSPGPALRLGTAASGNACLGLMNRAKVGASPAV